MKRPDNAFMFPSSSVDEDPALETVAEAKARASRAGPKAVSYHNTRFAAPALAESDGAAGFVPPSPSLNTSIIAARDARRSRDEGTTDTATDTEAGGGETPRVNGYAFVEEDEPDVLSSLASATLDSEPTYRDLLAGQVIGDGTKNPFQIRDVRRREELHLRMVERDLRKKRGKVAPPAGTTTTMTPRGQGTATATGKAGNMNLTPAAKRLLDRVGRTPVGRGGPERHGRKDRDRMDMWTPSATTPRRKKAAAVVVIGK